MIADCTVLFDVILRSPRFMKFINVTRIFLEGKVEVNNKGDLCIDKDAGGPCCAGEVKVEDNNKGELRIDKDGAS